MGCPMSISSLTTHTLMHAHPPGCTMDLVVHVTSLKCQICCWSPQPLQCLRDAYDHITNIVVCTCLYIHLPGCTMDLVVTSLKMSKLLLVTMASPMSARCIIAQILMCVHVCIYTFLEVLGTCWWLIDTLCHIPS